MKQEASGDDSGLTPRGKDEYDSTYTDLFSHHYSYNVTDVEMHIGKWEYSVTMLKERNRSMCGFLKKL